MAIILLVKAFEKTLIVFLPPYKIKNCSLFYLKKSNSPRKNSNKADGYKLGREFSLILLEFRAICNYLPEEEMIGSLQQCVFF